MATLKQLIEKASQLPKQEYNLWDEDLLSAVVVKNSSCPVKVWILG